MNFNYIVIVCLSLLTFRSVAQETSPVTGTVKDEQGISLPGVTVQILNTSWGAITNGEGNFTIAEVPAGKYTLSASFIGYGTRFQEIQLQGQSITVNFELQTSAQQLGEIVISAQKREERLQKVPLSVTAINAEKIEQLQISNVNELGRITPNFQVYDDGGSAFPLVAMRGITTIDNTPIVGMYVDDVPLFNIGSFPTYFNDIERIEILKGPQGTLYGRNSIGGVINVVSKKPTNYTTGFVTAGYGNLNQYDFQAGLSLPIVKDKLFARINGGATGRDGYVENTFDNTELLGREVYAGNLRLTFLPNNYWSFTLNAGVENRENIAYALIGGFGATGQVIDSLVANHPYETRQNTNGIYSTDTYNNAFKAGYDGNNFSFDAITAFQMTNLSRSNDDFDFSELAIQEVLLQEEDLYTISQELRIASNTERRFRWTGGLYFYHIERISDSRIENGQDNAFFAPTPEIAAQYPYTQIDDNTIVQNGFSVFGQAEYDLTERLTFTAGLRYELENSSLEASRRFEKDGEAFIYPALGAVPSQFDKQTEFDAISPKVNLAYQSTDNHLYYVNVARGYRPGGVNPFVADEGLAAFDPEFGWNYEIGTKNTLWNNRARINASAFYITYQGQQLFTILDIATVAFGRENIGNSRSYGLELESELVVAKGLNFMGSVGYLQTEFTDYEYQFTADGVNIATFDNEGNEQVVSPNWTANLMLDYTFNISAKWKSNLALDYQYQSEMFLDPENTAAVPAYGLLGGRLVVGNKNFELALWAKNITDVVYISYGYSVSGAAIFGNYGLPRTFGTSLTAKF
ncbi:MAG: TonB-dependent receptor [Thermonemataceae bacterium]